MYISSCTSVKLIKIFVQFNYSNCLLRVLAAPSFALNLLFLPRLIPSSVPTFVARGPGGFSGREASSAQSCLAGRPSLNTINQVGGSLNIIAENDCGWQTIEKRTCWQRLTESELKSENISKLILSDHEERNCAPPLQNPVGSLSHGPLQPQGGEWRQVIVKKLGKQILSYIFI